MWEVSRSYREAIKAQYPDLFTGKGRPLLKLIEYARTTRNHRKGTSLPIVSEEKLREFDALPDNTRPYAEKFIEYAHSILPKMVFSGYGSNVNARVLFNVGIRLETKEERFDANKVDWVTGKRMSNLQVEKTREAPKSIFEAQATLMGYLNRPCSWAWAKAKKRYWADGAKPLMAVLDTIDDTKPLHGVQMSFSPRERADADLLTIEADWQPIYGPSRTGNTHRLFSQNNYWSFLQLEVADYLLQDYVTLDLKACHLAVAAREWNIKPLLEIMGDPARNVWDELKAETGIDSKDLVKELTYAVVYGGGDNETSRIIREFIRRQRQASNDTGKRVRLTAEDHEEARHIRASFDASPIVNALKVGAQVAQVRIKDRGGIEDAFGFFHKLTDDANAKTLLALRSQSLELALLLPVLEVVKFGERDQQCRIVLWMHDGFTIYGRTDKQLERDVAQMQKVVGEEAKRRGIPTRLEVK